MVGVVVDDQHEPASIREFGAQDAGVSPLSRFGTSPASRGSLRQPLLRDPLTADDAEVGVAATAAPRSDQRHARSRDTEANNDPDNGHGIPFRPMPV
jgi:hypothetical protein